VPHVISAYCRRSLIRAWTGRAVPVSAFHREDAAVLHQRLPVQSGVGKGVCRHQPGFEARGQRGVAAETSIAFSAQVEKNPYS